METTDDHVLEPVALNLRPVLHLVGGDILGVAGDVVRRVGIRSLGTDGCHQLVVLIGNEVLGCQLAHGVNLVVGLAACLGVGQLTVGLVALLYLGKQGGLSLGIVRSVLLCALEHEVLQIVCQTGGLGRVVLSASTYGDVRLDTWLVLIDTQIDLQSVLQRVDTRVHRVARHRLIVLCTYC